MSADQSKQDREMRRAYSLVIAQLDGYIGLLDRHIVDAANVASYKRKVILGYGVDVYRAVGDAVRRLAESLRYRRDAYLKNPDRQTRAELERAPVVYHPVEGIDGYDLPDSIGRTHPDVFTLRGVYKGVRNLAFDVEAVCRLERMVAHWSEPLERVYGETEQFLMKLRAHMQHLEDSDTENVT